MSTELAKRYFFRLTATIPVTVTIVNITNTMKPVATWFLPASNKISATHRRGEKVMSREEKTSQISFARSKNKTSYLFVRSRGLHCGWALLV